MNWRSFWNLYLFAIVVCLAFGLAMYGSVILAAWTVPYVGGYGPAGILITWIVGLLGLVCYLDTRN
jgi:hypothetical protein